MAKIEAAIFDIGGVITAPHAESPGKAIQRELGLSDTKMKEVWDYYLPTFGSGKTTEAEFWADVSEKFSTPLVTPEDNLFGNTWENGLEIQEDLLEYVKELGKRGLKLAALSDTNIVHAKILAERGAYAPFDKLFLSHETGLRKPAPEVYELVIRELESAPSSTIYVDDLEINLKPAANLGMHTILAKSPDQVIDEIEHLVA